MGTDPASPVTDPTVPLGHKPAAAPNRTARRRPGNRATNHYLGVNHTHARNADGAKNKNADRTQIPIQGHDYYRSANHTQIRSA